MAQPVAASRYPDATETGSPPLALDMMQGLKVSGHLMSLPAGLFCIVNEPGAAAKNGLPGIRISQPPNGNADVEITGFRTDGWLAAEGDAALVRINRGPAQLLVTIYQSPSATDAAPKLQVRQLIGGSRGAGRSRAGGGAGTCPGKNGCDGAYPGARRYRCKIRRLAGPARRRSRPLDRGFCHRGAGGH